MKVHLCYKELLRRSTGGRDCFDPPTWAGEVQSVPTADADIRGPGSADFLADADSPRIRQTNTFADADHPRI